MLESRTMTLLSQLLLVSSLLLSFMENGRAGITSSYVRSEFPAVDIPLDDPVMAIPRGYNAPQQVRITQGDYDGKAVIITWVTMDEPGRSLVRYGKTERCRLRSRGKASNYTFYEYQSGYIHQCLVDNLEYDTKYYYKLGNGRSERTFSFRTPPAVGPDTPYTFGIIGDLGQTFNSLSTLEHYAQSNGQAVLFLGDISYADRYQYNDIGVRWDSWGRFAEQSTAYQPWLWSVGNHEIEFMTSLGETVPFKTYLHRFPTPYAASQSTDPLYYAVRRASAHIIVLNSYSAFATFTPQWFWLLQEFQRVDREKTPWLIVIVHKPIYNSNNAHYMEGEGMRVTFESWFVQNKVDMVLSGHVHAYERTHRISNIRYNVTYGYPYPVPDKSAPVYLTIGDGGNKEGLASKFRDPQPHFSAFREASYGHSTLEIKNRTHAIYSWHRNHNGNKVTADSFVFLNQRWASNLDRKYETRILPDIATT